MLCHQQCREHADVTGNITHRRGVGDYTYDTVHEHAVASIENSQAPVPVTSGEMYFTYDPTGQISMIEDMETPDGTCFDIGPDGQRWESYEHLYFGDYEESFAEGYPYGVTDKCFTYLNGGVISIKDASTGQRRFYYTMADHQGSITHVLDEDGSIVFTATYDAWGRQTVTHNAIGMYRGYCGHEMLNSLGLIHMNGRVYDPILGRFLSPDNYVQQPDNSQNFNRYSYCLNNPLKYIDKDGNSFSLIATAAIMGGALAGVTYASTMILPDASWNTKTFIKSIGIGATAAALNAATASIGKIFPVSEAASKFFNSYGYKLITQVTNSIITNSLFGEHPSLRQIAGIIISSAFATSLPTFQATSENVFTNAIRELGINSLNGFLTGTVQGIAQFSLGGNPQEMIQSMIVGTMSGLVRTGLMDAITGTPRKIEGIDTQGGVFRKGGLFSLIMKKFGVKGMTIGKNMWVDSVEPSKSNINHLFYHELAHVNQQTNMGWAAFYGKYIMEWLTSSIRKENMYTTPGYLDYAAEHYYLFFNK